MRTMKRTRSSERDLCPFVATFRACPCCFPFGAGYSGLLQKSPRFHYSKCENLLCALSQWLNIYENALTTILPRDRLIMRTRSLNIVVVQPPVALDLLNSIQ